MRILITGANGLVGQGVLQECLQAEDVEAIVALGRRTSGAADHPKVTDLICPDFSDLSTIEDRLQPFDACLYCVGAPTVGTAEAEYRHVTFDLTTHVAQTLARLNPALTFIYISGAYSSPDSRVMQLRIKGETERALGQLPITTVMLRPGGIQPIGDVHSPHKGLDTMYKFVGPLMGLGVRMMPSLMTTTRAVARTMLRMARDSDPPVLVENHRINQLGR